jgi:hypothetical protein
MMARNGPELDPAEWTPVAAAKSAKPDLQRIHLWPVYLDYAQESTEALRMVAGQSHESAHGRDGDAEAVPLCS